jgi:6-phosphogluconolactonase
MNQKDLFTVVKPWDERRLLALPGEKQMTLQFCVDHFLFVANEAIEEHGYFAVALSGGSTPKAIFEALAKPENRDKTDWTRFLVFWSDERSVASNDPESNYHMAMESGWNLLPVPESHIFRMQAESNIVQHAKEYEELIVSRIPQGYFDLIMLGMGDDGHTASLFPYTTGLHVDDKLVVANEVPQKSTWRMSFTFKCINAARHIAVYVLGAGKESMLQTVLKGPYQPDQYPSQKVGTSTHQALWIADNAASQLLKY